MSHAVVMAVFAGQVGHISQRCDEPLPVPDLNASALFSASIWQQLPHQLLPHAAIFTRNTSAATGITHNT
jgi:hypothetical protein